jgi:uncharacterized coiled-coil DUF342 family protein
LAEYTINHNITEGRGARGTTGGTSKPINEDQLARKIGKVYEKVAKDTNKSLQNNLTKELDKVLAKVIRELVRHQRGGKPSGGISDQDITKLIKNATKNITTEAGNSLIRELKKVKPGQAGNSRELETLFKSLDRRIAGLAPAINTALSKAGVEISPQGLKIISDAIGASMRGVVSKEFGTAMRDFNRTVDSLMRGFGEAVKAFESIKKIKTSGGGIDVGESRKALEHVGRFAKEFKNVSDDFKNLSQSVKTLARDQKNIMKEISDALSEMKKDLGSKAKVITQKPVILDPTKWEKSAEAFTKEWAGRARDIKKEIGGSRTAASSAAKEIKELANNMTESGNQIAKLGKKIDQAGQAAKKISQPPAIAKKDDTAKELAPLFKNLTQLLEKLGREITTKRNEMSKEVQSDKLDKKVLENFLAEQAEFTKAIKSKNPTTIKEAAGKGLYGVDPKLTEGIRDLTSTIEESIVAGSKLEIDKAFTDGLKSSVKSGVAEAMEKALEKPKTKQVSPAKTVDVKPIVRSIELLNSKLRGPQNVNVYPERAIPPTKGGFEPQFEAAPTKGQLNQYKLVQDRIKNLSSSLVDLQNYIVNTMEAEFETAGKRWAVVREGTEKSIQEFFTLVKGANAKTSGKQYAFDIANIDALKKQLFLKGKGAATKGSPASIVKEMVDTISTELAANLPSSAAGVQKVAEWLKAATEEQIKAVKEIKPISDKLITIKKTDVKGVLPTEALRKQLTDLLVDDRNTLERVFKATVGKAEATKKLRDDKVLRSVSLPAARLTKTGSPVFETAKGSQRSLQRFATFKTGFEEIYEKLAEQQMLVYSKNYADKIKNVGVKPVGLDLTAANQLAEDMLKDFASANLENFNKFREQVGKATAIKSTKLGPANREKLISGVQAAGSVNLGEALQPGDLAKATNDFIDAMKKAGLSAYDVVKTLDKIEFQNVY